MGGYASTQAATTRVYANITLHHQSNYVLSDDDLVLNLLMETLPSQECTGYIHHTNNRSLSERPI